MHMCICMHACTRVHGCVCVCMCVRMCTRVRVRAHVHVHAHALCACTVCMCMCCRLMPKDDILWYAGRNCSAKGEEGQKQLATRILCVFSGTKNYGVIRSCVVTMQYDDELDSCSAFQANSPPQGDCKNLLEALTMANNVQRVSDYCHLLDAGNELSETQGVTH